MATGDIPFRLDGASVSGTSSGCGGAQSIVSAWSTTFQAGTEQNPNSTIVTVDHQYPEQVSSNTPVPFDPRKRYNIIFQEV